jgi:hypothetical protein
MAPDAIGQADPGESGEFGLDGCKQAPAFGPLSFDPLPPVIDSGDYPVVCRVHLLNRNDLNFY